MKRPTGAWQPASWRDMLTLHQPLWPDAGHCRRICENLRSLPPLVFAGECRTLQRKLADAAGGRAFVLQGGDCAEDFSACSGPRIRNLLRVIFQMTIVLSYIGEKPVVNIGRLAGQYGKPRSRQTETVDGREIPSYQGEMINGPAADPESRIPDPGRMLEGYFRAAATLNLVRAFTMGGYADLHYAEAWHRESFRRLSVHPAYKDLLIRIRKGIRFTRSLDGAEGVSPLQQRPLYTSHEALILDYEEAMTRVDTTTGDWYDTSAHMLWIGNRTRQPDGGHVEFLRGVKNPVGVKLGGDLSHDELLRLIERLNPDNEAGRLVLIPRFGRDEIDRQLPAILRRCRQEGFCIVWLCDPMHGNSFYDSDGVKTRRMSDIVAELRSFFAIHQAEGTIPAGVHLELTGEDVTECLGSSLEPQDSVGPRKYRSHCDPRLNAAQSVELAFRLGELLAGPDS